MTRQDIFDFCRRCFGTEPDFPWQDTAAVLRHDDNKKWYGIVMEVDRRRLGLDGRGLMDVLNLKADPALIGMLRQKAGFYPAYHMNKERWITVILDGSVADEKIKMLLHMSYEATAPKYSKKRK